jgi:diguanylate cyclase (GGDEF)-like protein
MQSAKRNENTNLLEISDLVASVSDAIAIVDKDGQVLLQNLHFDNLPKALQVRLVNNLQRANNQIKNYFLMGYQVKLVSLVAATAIIVEPFTKELSQRLLPITELTRNFAEHDDIFNAVALAIQQSLGWKWVSITRFIGRDRLEVLTFIQDGVKLENYEYDIIGTPCKTVIDTVKFTFFENVVSAFPNYQALQDLGAVTYAGLIFKDSNGTPVGHVMAMHDDEKVNYAQAQHVFEVATLTLSAHFKLTEMNRKLREANKMALIDKLTGVGNRLAFDNKLETIAKLSHQRKSDDHTVAMIDLDNLKPLNDTLGHAAGDKFIRLMAKELEKLGRSTDRIYRIGGDEFALVFSQNINHSIDSILKRFSLMERKVSKALGFDIGASIGFASLSETSGNIKGWIKLADKRMYECKTTRHKLTTKS